ncbi:MAG: MEDS domain-containing protein [Vicinamibacterales bacterium]
MLKLKQRTPRQPSATHFEQVPLAAVKAAVASRQPTHAVQFYESADALCRLVGRFIGDGLERGAAAALMVTPDHAGRITACLREAGLDVDALTRDGALVIVDAQEMLDRFMVDGMPNPGAFRRAVGGLFRDLRRARGDRAIRAYGELVDVLWKERREAAAIRLETLWNALAESDRFDLSCGYSMGNFYKGSMIEAVERQYTHGVPADGGAHVPTGP